MGGARSSTTGKSGNRRLLGGSLDLAEYDLNKDRSDFVLRGRRDSSSVAIDRWKRTRPLTQLVVAAMCLFNVASESFLSIVWQAAGED